MDHSSLLSETVKGSVDYKGQPAIRSETGRWRSAVFIIGVEIAERFSYNGISSNLITYLTGPLQQSMVTAAVNVNTWTGVSYMLPLFGAFVADAFLGRFRTILMATLFYVLGLGLLTASAVLPSLSPPSCHDSVNTISCHPSQFQIIIFFSSLYLVALAQGMHKPCTQAFGADQFEVTDPKECKSKSSFFNWWYVGICSGALCSHSILTYIQDNMNWGLGFGIPCICMVVALAIFLLGTKTYRHSFNDDDENQFRRMALAFVAAAKSWRTNPSTATDEEEGETLLQHDTTDPLRFLDKAPATSENYKEAWLVSSVDQVEEAKAILRLFPFWATCVVYTIVDAQYYTFFTKQGATMDRTIGSTGLKIPPASLQTFISISIIVFMPIYDRVLIPIARVHTNIHSGITTLQRIGTGIFLSLLAMVVAAVVEKERLQVAIDSKIVDTPNATVPMGVWWLVPQYILLGIAEALSMVGLQEFFYDQMPNGLKSVGLAFYLSIFGVGSFLSSFLVSGIEKVTGGDGRDSWFSNNLNRAHLDYFYWLLAGLSTIELVIFLLFARSYIYKRVDI